MKQIAILNDPRSWESPGINPRTLTVGARVTVYASENRPQFIGQSGVITEVNETIDSTAVALPHQWFTVAFDSGEVSHNWYADELGQPPHYRSTRIDPDNEIDAEPISADQLAELEADAIDAYFQAIDERAWQIAENVRLEIEGLQRMAMTGADEVPF